MTVTQDEMARMYRDEVARAEELGVDESVRRTRTRLMSRVDRHQVSALLRRARHETGVTGTTPAEALVLYRYLIGTYLADGAPVLAWLMRAFTRLSGRDLITPIEVTEDRVAWEVATGTRCPLLAACEGDVERCAPFCRAHFAHSIPLQPEATVLLGMLRPPMHFTLVRMRAAPGEPCVYAIERARK